MTKPIKITIVEYLNDDNNWEWFDIYKNSVLTPEESIMEYLKNEIEFDGWETSEIKQEDGWFYADNYEDVRARTYTI